MRILDSKNPALRELIEAAPLLSAYLDDDSRAHFDRVQTSARGCGRAFTLNPGLVRGLDYYSRTVFEWVTDRLGAQSAVCSGGRYDGLVAQLGGRDTPAVGWALGIERIVELLQAEGVGAAEPPADVHLVAAGDAERRFGFKLAEQLRERLPGLKLSIGGPAAGFKARCGAPIDGARYALIVGESELAAAKASLKPLREERPQQLVTVDESSSRSAKCERRHRLAAHCRPEDRVDEYLSDKEQVQRLRQWWRENGWFLLGGVALGLLALYGYNQYFAYQDRKSEGAAELYAQIRQATDDSDTAAAEAAFAQLRSEFPDTAYTYQASLLVASAEVVTAPDNAADKLRFTMEQSSDPELAMVARLRLARVLAYREQYQEALALLEVPAPGQFAGRIAEIRGDIHAALGETDAARTAYLQAMVTPGAELLDRSFLQMKIADLPGGSGSATDAPVRRRFPPADRPPRGACRRGAGRGGRVTPWPPCAGDAAARRARRLRRRKDTSEPPAELTTFEATLDVEKVWSGKVGGKSERLRLGLRPATDGARIYAGAYDGQVARSTP